MRIGRIIRIDGIRVVATFYERLQPFLTRNGNLSASPRINSFVKTNVGLDTIICQITGEHEMEYDKAGKALGEHQEPAGPFLVDLEVRGHISNGVFKGGLRALPIVGAIVESLDDKDVASMHGADIPYAMSLGNDLFDESSVVEIDANKLMAGHIGIFGNTGSGKSNTLAKVLYEYAKQFDRNNKAARILVFDLNNEYGGDAVLPYEDKRVYKLTTRNVNTPDKIPIDFSQLDEDSWGTLLRATQKTQMPVVRRAYKRWKEFDEAALIERIEWSLVDKRSRLFFTLRQYCEGYVVGLDDISFNETTNGFYYPKKGKTGYIDERSDVESITLRNNMTPLELFYLCLAFEVARSSESGTNYDYVQPLLPRAKHVLDNMEKTFKNTSCGGLADIFDKSNFIVVQLGNTNADTREMIPALLTELLLKEAIGSKGDATPRIISTIVIDEAHNLLSYDSKQDDLVHDNTLKVFEKVVKEGRKFGVFLCAASQRPSDISPTVTSQLHNFFIHKLVNPNDIERIRKTVSFMGDGSLSMLSALGQGECILTGPAIHMPQYIYVHKLEETNKPNSDDIVIFGEQGLIPAQKEISNQESDEYAL